MSHPHVPTDRRTEMDFHKEMVKLYHRHVDELRRRPSYFLREIQIHGGLKAAKRLLARSGSTRGLDAAAKAHRPDLTVEYVIIEGGYQHLFGPWEIWEAKRRLDRMSGMNAAR